MKRQDLVDALEAIHPLSRNFQKSLFEELVSVTFPRNHVLLDIPSVAEHIYFIDRGFAMSYSFDDTRRVIECFWKQGQILTPGGSFCAQTPTTVRVQLMRDSDLWCLSREGLNRLLANHQETHFLYHKMISRIYMKFRSRIHDIQHLSAAERFDSLLESFPDIEQIVSQENIASYLGITPQSLSRIKRGR
jgi:CRP-like cAMP-binding protein